MQKNPNETETINLRRVEERLAVPGEVRLREYDSDGDAGLWRTFPAQVMNARDIKALLGKSTGMVSDHHCYTLRFMGAGGEWLHVDEHDDVEVTLTKFSRFSCVLQRVFMPHPIVL